MKKMNIRTFLKKVCKSKDKLVGFDRYVSKKSYAGKLVSTTGEGGIQKENCEMDKDVEKKVEETTTPIEKEEAKVEEKPPIADEKEKVEVENEKKEDDNASKSPIEDNKEEIPTEKEEAPVENKVTEAEPSGNGIRVEDLVTKDMLADRLSALESKLESLINENKGLKDKLSEMTDKYETKDFGNMTKQGVPTKDKVANDTFDDYIKQFC